MSRRLPPHLSDLLSRLSEHGGLFIELYEEKEERMQAIASKLKQMAQEVIEVQKGANTGRNFGVVLGGIGILGIAVALLARGSLASAAIAGSMAVTGGASIITANVIKEMAEKHIKTVEALVKEFMTIMEQQKDVLRNIKEVSEELEEKSSALMTTTGEQANRILSRTEKLQQILRQVAEQSNTLVNVTGTTLDQAMVLLNFLISVTRITPTPEEDEKLRNYITDAAFQCGKTVSEFAKMRNMLKDFDEMQTE